ncbi:transposable element Tcb2 transposase [Trichonephila clavipes]|nr:transposable element Tcb2 transposase [Trichonephila clavipes]
MVRKWVRQFIDGCTNAHDEARSGRPCVVDDGLDSGVILGSLCKVKFWVPSRTWGTDPWIGGCESLLYGTDRSKYVHENITRTIINHHCLVYFRLRIYSAKRPTVKRDFANQPRSSDEDDASVGIPFSELHANIKNLSIDRFSMHQLLNTAGFQCFYPRSNHWEVGGRPQCDKCGCRVRASFHDFGDNFKPQEQLSGGSVVVVHEEPHPQMTGTLSYRPEETGGRQREKSLDTRHRRLDDRYRVLPWPEDCTVVVCLHDALYDESRFSLSSDSHRILIWRERGSRNHPSNIIERDRYGGRGVLVWGGIMLGSRTDLHIFDAGSVNGTRYCNEILLPYVRLFRGAMGLQFLFMDDNTPCHRTVAAEQLLESEDIERMDWPARSPDLNPIEHVWDFLGRRLAARTLPPVTIRELRLALQDEWAAMPQQLIDTLILSMGRRCETCLAVRRDHIPY